MGRPDRSEYAEYYGRYIDLVPEGDIVSTLEDQLESFLELLCGIPVEKAGYRYEPGKWSVKEVVGHIIDVERVFGTRALAFARSDRSAYPSFEQDDYVANGNFDERTLEDLARELEHLRKSLLVLFRSFDDAVWMRRGIASGFEFTTRAVPWILAGHLGHHRSILEERYLKPGDPDS